MNSFSFFLLFDAVAFLSLPVFGFTLEPSPLVRTGEDVPTSGSLGIDGSLVAFGVVTLLVSTFTLYFGGIFITRSLLEAGLDLVKLETLV